MSEARRYRLDELRRFASALIAAVGVRPPRGSALADHLLWFDTVGASSFGIVTLPSLLERLERREVDLEAEGLVRGESAGAAVLDGQNGLPPLILSRAGELAIEKARDAGVGLVRVTNILATGPAAGLAAEMAVGPVAAFWLGPGPCWTVALPRDGGMPLVVDSTLGAEGSLIDRRRAVRDARDLVPDLLGPWASAIVPEAGWLVAAIAINAIEPLASFRERVAARMNPTHEAVEEPPTPWESRRREARENGVIIAPSAWSLLNQSAERLGVIPPEPRLVQALPTTPATDAS